MVRLLISILFHLRFYPLPDSVLHEHSAAAASCVLLLSMLFLWYTRANLCREARHNLLQGSSAARDQFLLLFSDLCPLLLVRDSVVESPIADK